MRLVFASYNRLKWEIFRHICNKRFILGTITVLALVLLNTSFLLYLSSGRTVESRGRSTSRYTGLNLLPSDQTTKTYTVEGWGVNSNRDTRLYVLPDEHTTVINSDCPTGLLLTVVVCSAPAHFELRSAIRDTWASLASPSTKVVFLVGLSGNASVETLIRQESESHGDMVQERFIDSYNNLTIKSVFMLKWVLRNCPSFRFLMKSDDDIYLNLPTLIEELKLVGNKSSSNLLTGSKKPKTVPYRQPSDRWFMPRHLFPDQLYPDYLLGGSGYLMSSDVVQKLFKAALETPLIHLEDVFVTGVCARVAGVTPTSHVGFGNWSIPVNFSSIVTSRHKMSPRKLRKAFLINYLKNWIHIFEPTFL